MLWQVNQILLTFLCLMFVNVLRKINVWSVTTNLHLKEKLKDKLKQTLILSVRIVIIYLWQNHFVNVRRVVNYLVAGRLHFCRFALTKWGIHSGGSSPIRTGQGTGCPKELCTCAKMVLSVKGSCKCACSQ